MHWVSVVISVEARMPKTEDASGQNSKINGRLQKRIYVLGVGRTVPRTLTVIQNTSRALFVTLARVLPVNRHISARHPWSSAPGRHAKMPAIVCWTSESELRRACAV